MNLKTCSEPACSGQNRIAKRDEEGELETVLGFVSGVRRQLTKQFVPETIDGLLLLGVRRSREKYPGSLTQTPQLVSVCLAMLTHEDMESGLQSGEPAGFKNLIGGDQSPYFITRTHHGYL